jgi:glycosyltransferase involved in cell wall biosynthesis
MEDLGCRRASQVLWQHLEAARPDVVIAGAIAYPSGATAVRWACAREKRVVIHDDARVPDVPRGRLTTWVKGRIYRNVDAMLIPAPSHAPDYVSWGIPPERLFFGLNAVDNRAFAQRAKRCRQDAEGRRTQLGLPHRFLLGVGRQVAKKNWNFLIDAWVAFKRRKPENDLELVLVGDGPARPALEAMCKALGSSDIRLRVFVQPDEIADYCALASAVVLPSRVGETWGLVINEAMACGLPVLVSRECGCAATLVHPEENGWLFRPDCEEELVAALLALGNASTEALQDMGRKSREIVAGWGLERFCQGLLEAVEFVGTVPAKRKNVVDRAILSLWKGRYRPT